MNSVFLLMTVGMLMAYIDQCESLTRYCKRRIFGKCISRRYRNDCGINTCGSNGSCEEITNGYNCVCHTGFNGRHCEININDCTSCSGHGYCTDLINDYRCNCNTGYTGRDCEININDCVPTGICGPNGRCQDLVANYRCNCLPGYNGRHCEIDIDECAPSDACDKNMFCIDKINDYDCYCKVGFSGENCTTVAQAEITGIEPRVGVFAGSTKITIYGNNLKANYTPSIYLDNGMLLCEQLIGNNEVLICITEAILGDDVSLLGSQLIIKWGLSQTNITLPPSYTFTYVENPEIMTIQPMITIPEGGIMMTIIGDRLEAVLVPQLIINVTITRKHFEPTTIATTNDPSNTTENTTVSSAYIRIQQASTLTDLNNSTDMMTTDISIPQYVSLEYVIDCTLNEGNNLCLIPKLQLPEGIALEGDQCSDSYFDLCYLEATIGVSLDGFLNYTEMSEMLPQYERLTIHAAPKILDPNSHVTYRTWGRKRDSFIKIQGYRFDVFKGLINITIDDQPCQILGDYVLESEIRCEPINSRISTPPSTRISIVMSLGDWRQIVGYVEFQYSIWDCRSCFLAIVIGGTMFFALCVVFTAIVIVIGYRIRKVKKLDEKINRMNGDSFKIDLAKMSGEPPLKQPVACQRPELQVTQNSYLKLKDMSHGFSVLQFIRRSKQSVLEDDDYDVKGLKNRQKHQTIMAPVDVGLQSEKGDSHIDDDKEDSQQKSDESEEEYADLYTVVGGEPEGKIPQELLYEIRQNIFPMSDAGSTESEQDGSQIEMQQRNSLEPGQDSFNSIQEYSYVENTQYSTNKAGKQVTIDEEQNNDDDNDRVTIYEEAGYVNHGMNLEETPEGCEGSIQKSSN